MSLASYRLSYQRACLIAAALVPAFGVFYNTLYPAAVDPLWVRLLISGLMLLVFWLSHVNGFVRQHLVQITCGLLYCLTGWLIVVVAANTFTPVYAIGLMFAIAAIGTVVGMGVNHLAPIVWYFGVTLVGVVGAALWVTAPQVHVVLLALIVIGEGFVTVVATAARLGAEQQMEQAQAHLQRSEAQLSAAQRLARLGHWLWDLRTNEAVWSDEEYRLLGLEPGAAPSNLATFLKAVHPEDRERMRRRILAARHDEALRRVKDLECRIIRPDGEERVMRMDCEIVRDADGEPLHMLSTTLDVTQQKRHERELERARARAEELLSLRTSMLNNMSHELRTPLTGIIGFAEVLAEEVPDAHRDMAGLVLSSAQRLRATISSVLDLAKIESGSLSPALEVLDVREAVREVTALLQPRATDKALTLETHLPAAPARAHLDARCLHRILHNLVGNALKFTEQGGVTVRVSIGGDEVRICVRDTGIGISEEFLPDLFSEFRQESNGLTRSHEGSGLGLSITRRLVGLMNGEIHVESRKGEGSAFTVCFPHIAEVHEAVSGGAAHGASGKERASDAPPSSSACVLVVEANPDTQRLVQQFLQPHYQVEAAGGIDEALRLLRAQPFDMLLLGINLGQCDRGGVELLQTARSLPGRARTPATALTAYFRPGDREQFLEAGFDHYLSKPFTRKQLLQTVEQAVEV